MSSIAAPVSHPSINNSAIPDDFEPGKSGRERAQLWQQSSGKPLIRIEQEREWPERNVEMP